MTRKPPIKNSRAVKLPNGARAVMAGRKKTPDFADFFPTPPWATRALMEIVLPYCVPVLPRPCDWSIWEPACGEGHMADVLEEYCPNVRKSDLYHYGDHQILDFLSVLATSTPGWIITNPPFIRSLEFTRHALELARVGVAMFVRTQWATEGIGRYEYLWRDRPPTRMAFFSERVPLCKGKWDPTGGTATAYCWLVWVHGREPMAPFWIPPGQRKALTRPDDIARFAAWSLPQQEAAE